MGTNSQSKSVFVVTMDDVGQLIRPILASTAGRWIEMTCGDKSTAAIELINTIFDELTHEYRDRHAIEGMLQLDLIGDLVIGAVESITDAPTELTPEEMSDIRHLTYRLIEVLSDNNILIAAMSSQLSVLHVGPDYISIIGSGEVRWVKDILHAGTSRVHVSESRPRLF